MLSMQACFGTDYLTKEVGKIRLGYYADAVAEGEPPGRWYGDGAVDLGLSGVVDHEVMAAVYDHVLDPRDENTHSRSTWGKAAALGSGHRSYRSAAEIYEGLVAKEPGAGPERREQLRAKAEKSAHQAKSHYDATFSAPKSWSVAAVAFEKAAADAAAAGDAAASAKYLGLRDAIEDAVRAGGSATIDYLQDVAGYSRVGKDGLVSVDAHRFTVAQFLQHDSRNHDPQLHVHQAIFNRVRCPDGQWRALDGRALMAHKGAADAVGMRAAEARLTQAGFWLVARADGVAREIMGVPKDVMDGFSSRGQELGELAETWMEAYRQRFGREPSGPMRENIYEQACLATRKEKSHLAETAAQTLERYEAKAAAHLEGGLARVAAQVSAYLGERQPVEMWSPDGVITAAVGALAESHQRWRRPDLLAAINAALPAQLGLPPERVRQLLEELTDTALADSRVVALEDEEPVEGLDDSLVLTDGRSAYGPVGGRYYSTDTTITGEQVLREACVPRGAPIVDAEAAAGWVARFAESGVELGADQRAALMGVLTSSAWVESIVAAAGTGKSFTVGAIADAWTAETGGRLFALASGENATELLAEDGLTARNITRWLDTQERLDVGGGGEDDAGWRLAGGDLVVVDEAGMTPTADLVAIQQRCAAAGVKLLLTGDPEQLAAVGAGGALADVAERAPCYELTEVRRFEQDWEAAASLKLRGRDATGLEDYAKRARIHDCGTVEQAEAAVATAWLADHVAGKRTAAIVGTNETAGRVSARVRTELVKLGRVSESGVLLARDGVLAGEGDLIRARKNGWHLLGVAGNTTAPINKHTYKVQEAREDGSLVVRHVTGGIDGQLGPVLTLPAGYVREHVTSGYAATVHAVQGATLDTTHPLIGPGMDAGGVYVGMSRGSKSNTAHVVTQAVAADAPEGQENTVEARSGRAVLADILCLEIDTSDRGCSALRYAELAAERARSVKTSMDRFVHETGVATAGRVGAVLDRLVADGSLAEQHRVALAADGDAVPALERLLRAAEICGHNHEEVLAGAVGAGSLDDARDVGRVLHSRISTQLAGQLTPRIRGCGDLIPRGIIEAQQQRLEALAGAVDDRRRELGTRLAEDPPRWAVRHLGPVPEDTVARAEWEHAAGWVGAHQELAEVGADTTVLGTPPSLSRVEHHAVYRAAHTALGAPDAGEDEAGCSNALLAARVRAWDREQAWMAPYVGDELAAAHAATQQAQQTAALTTAQADIATSDAERQRLAGEANKAARQAGVLSAKVTELERLDLDRGRCWAETAVTRDKAERAKTTLDLRGIDVDEMPADATTAEQWLDAEQTDRGEGDAHRPIVDEAELTDALTNAERAEYDQLVAGEWDHDHVVETAVPDIRDSAAMDPIERSDLPCRPVPTVGELAAQVNRAHAATTELVNRWRDEHAIEQAYQDQVPYQRASDDTHDDDQLAAAG